MRKKKKQHDEESMDESWLIPYSDMLTLLLALFIVLFAMSEIDVKKYEELSKVFKSEFSSGGNSFLEHSTSVVEPTKKTSEELTEDEMEEELASNELDQLHQLQADFNAYIEAEDLADVLGTKLTDEGLMLVILNDVFFDSGSATINASGKELAEEVATLLYTDPPHQIVVSGHTDSRPIKNSNFKSNWDLSVTRAVNFMGLLLENPKLDPDRFSAKGYGEHQPIAPNDSDKNRAKNRRVEVLILPNYEIKVDEAKADS